MKQLFPSWAALALLAPLSLIVALVVFPLGCGGGGGSSATPTPTKGFVEVGFVDSPSSDFQRILLNVLEVRINPSTDPNVAEGDPNWEVIPAPAGVLNLGELQIDLSAIQDQVQLFNTDAVRAQEFRQLEIVLDPNNPGSIVPNCPKAGRTNEGCLTYPFQLASTSTALRVSTTFQVTDRGLAPVVIDFIPGMPKPPSAPGGSYVFAPTLKPAPFSNLMGAVTGTVTSPPPVGGVVTAELSGTNNVIAQAHVFSDTGTYTLELPAGTSGTLYDVFLSGGGGADIAHNALMVARGKSVTADFSTNSESNGSLSGVIADARTGDPIQGATLNLLLPAQGSGVDCSATPTPPQCVVIASANTDENGHYPTPGNIFHEPPFSAVPIGTYGLQVRAAGYDTIVSKASVATQGQPGLCGSPATFCNFSLKSDTISGTVSLDMPPTAGSQVQALVTAEDSGTNTLENVAMVTIPTGATSAPFTINVPTSPSSFDLFASAQDFFNGAPSPFPGHTIEVLSNVAGRASGQSFAPLTCIGHGSLTGGISTLPDSGTTVVMSKDNVQLFQSQVGPAGAANAGQFSFCAPPDMYTLQRFENGLPAGSPVTATIPSPKATSTPCPGICGFKGGTCPGICQNQSVALP